MVVSKKASCMRSNPATADYGSCSQLIVNNYKGHSYVEFDISNLSNSLDSVYFNIYKLTENPATSGRVVEMKRITSPWLEGTNCQSAASNNVLSYNNNRPSNSRVVDGSWTQAPPQSWIKVNITAAVQAAKANGETTIGWYLEGKNGCLCTEEYASDDTLGYEPFLEYYQNSIHLVNYLLNDLVEYYPTITNGLVYFDFHESINTKDVTIKVYNNTGQHVSSVYPESRSGSFIVRAAPGLYFIKTQYRSLSVQQNRVVIR